ncbi:MAG TPA: right-handed parallel beta-helix repeat-containing protein [Puia sp.]|nr:right-handed parallel beta-helix repeat-containing protein [Puia sp.]
MGILLLSHWLVVAGGIYYIDAKGDDRQDGSRAHPWSTLAPVNRLHLQAGDSVFFRGGQSFTGTLKVDNGGGSALHPVWIGSYGQGSATIVAGDSSAVILYRAGWISLQHLRLVGAGRKNGNVKNGLYLINCHHIMVDGIDITGFQKAGLMIYSCTDVLIERVYAHENGAAGIAVEGSGGKRESNNLRIRYCRADDNPGDPTNLTNHSGNGIVVGHCSNLLIDHCSATNNGWDMPRIGNGPVGIWCYEADSVTIQYCLAYQNKTSAGGADGGGFDLDGGVTNSVIQYCLSYGNQGSGYCIFQYWGASPWYHNIIRWNISEDDGGVSDSRAGVYVWNSSGDAGQFYDCVVYNNTIYNTKEAAISFSEKSARKQFAFYNNIFVGRDSLIRGDRGADVFGGNDWWLLRGGAGDTVGGLYLDPAFSNPGHTRVTAINDLPAFDKYRIPLHSPLREQGVDLHGSFGIDAGAKDFNGQKAPLRGIGASF